MARWVSLASLAALVSRATRNTQKHPIKDPQQKHSLLQEKDELQYREHSSLLQEKVRCFSIASTARSYKKMVTSPILFPLKHGA